MDVEDVAGDLKPRGKVSSSLHSSRQSYILLLDMHSDGRVLKNTGQSRAACPSNLVD